MLCSASNGIFFWFQVYEVKDAASVMGKVHMEVQQVDDAHTAYQKSVSDIAAACQIPANDLTGLKKARDAKRAELFAATAKLPQPQGHGSVEAWTTIHSRLREIKDAQVDIQSGQNVLTVAELESHNQRLPHIEAVERLGRNVMDVCQRLDIPVLHQELQQSSKCPEVMSAMAEALIALKTERRKLRDAGNNLQDAREDNESARQIEILQQQLTNVKKRTAQKEQTFQQKFAEAAVFVKHFPEVL